LLRPGLEVALTSAGGCSRASHLDAALWLLVCVTVRKDWRYRARDGELPEFLDILHRDGAIAVAAHPFATCLACAWKFGYDGMDAVEVWNGPWTADDEVAVQMWNGMLVESARTGQWLPAMGDSDAHSEPQVIGLPHNVVLADDLDTRAVLAGLKAGRTWIAESSGVDLTFTASVGGATADGVTAGIGERLRVAPGELVTVTLGVSGVPSGTVVLITDEGQTFTQALDASGAGTATWPTTAGSPRTSAPRSATPSPAPPPSYPATWPPSPTPSSSASQAARRDDARSLACPGGTKAAFIAVAECH
jgi:hypothetical protein